jgi:hypothetical protein
MFLKTATSSLLVLEAWEVTQLEKLSQALPDHRDSGGLASICFPIRDCKY